MSQDRTYVRKRRVPRRAFNRKIGVLAKGHYYTTEALEIGEGGMLFRSNTPLLEGQRVVVSFSIPGLVHIVARSIVKYVKQGQAMSYGVQFETIDFDARRKIRSYVAQKSKEELNAV
ncbi:MAG: PilZ domain-containing protein [Bdellovibrionales bacterium]|nr:PilZ domain-containing protein [Bdellovibrionales bacterium]